jgi:hypothetical protein
MSVKTTTFWSVTPCSVADGYQRFEVTCCLGLYDRRWVRQVPSKSCYQVSEHVEDHGRSSQSSEYAPGWTIRGSNSGRDKGLSLPQIVETGSAVHPACYSNCTAWGMMFTTHLHLVLSLIKTGAIPLLPHMPSCRR